MQFKIDENLHSDVAELLKQHGHDAMTVHSQGMQGEADSKIANICRAESRAIITMDLDFSDVRYYPPEDFHGIIVLRLNDQSRVAVLNLIAQIVPLLETEPLIGNLWVVQRTGVRIREGSR